jgi:hypothetical protein
MTVTPVVLISLLLGGGRVGAEETETAEESKDAETEIQPLDDPYADEAEPAVETVEEAEAEPEEEPTGIPAIQASYGSMRIGAIIQAGFEFLPDARQDQRNTFDLSRARLRIDGHLLSESLTYLFVGDATEGLAGQRRNGAPGGEMTSDRPGYDVPFLLDAKITWKIDSIGAAFSAGRFVPAWGLTMPERPSRLGAISYPLYLYGGAGAPGRFRNAGFDAQFRIIDFLAFEAGVFNGGLNSWGDDNDAKDVIAGILLEPAPGLRLRAASFFSFPRAVGATREDGTAIEDGTETQIQPIIELRYQDYGLDLMLGGAASFVERHEQDVREDYYSAGGMAHVGYLLIGDWFQLFARGELWDPDVGGGGNDQLRITAGPQLFLESIHSQIRINYIYDRFGSDAAMCRVYLDAVDCSDTSEIPEAKRSGSTVLVQATIDI